MKTDAELDEELRYKRGDQFIVNFPVLMSRAGQGLTDWLNPNERVKIVGYGRNEYRGIGYLVECDGIRYDRPLPRKCLDRYCRQIKVD